MKGNSIRHCEVENISLQFFLFPEKYKFSDGLLTEVMKHNSPLQIPLRHCVPRLANIPFTLSLDRSIKKRLDKVVRTHYFLLD